MMDRKLDKKLLSGHHIIYSKRADDNHRRIEAIITTRGPFCFRMETSVDLIITARYN